MISIQFRRRGIRSWKVLQTVMSSTLAFFRYLLLTFASPSDPGEVAIPSQSFVLAAKEKRERLRTSGPASPHTEDYISLSLTKRDDEYLGPHPESRLMREDDDLGEGDDGVIDKINFLSPDLTLALDFAEYTSAKMRIALGKKAKKAEADKVREEMQDLIADALVYIVPHLNSLLTYFH